MNGAHSLFSPSSAERWVHCPGSVQLTQKYPDLGGDEDSRDGSTCHALAAGLLTGRNLEVHPVTAEIIDAAKVYANTVRKLHGGIAAKIWVEEPVTINNDCWGTPDAWFLDGSTLHLPDLKYGWGLVDVYRNWQLILYAIGVKNKYETPVFDTAVLHIIQPRPWHPDGQHRTWTVSLEDLIEYERMVNRQIMAAKSEHAQCVTGTWCTHCPSVIQCRAAQLAWPVLWEATGAMAGLDHTPQQLSLELSLLTRAESMIKARRVAVEAAALGMVRDGVEIPGWQAGRTAGKKVWSAGADEVRALATMYGVNVCKPAELVTPTQATKAGLPAEIVAQYTTLTPGSLRMEPVNPNKPTTKELFNV